MNLECPPDDGAGYPSLGPQVVDWMQENLVFGPGDLRGQPLILDAEQQAFIWRFYEHYPKDHAKAGRRRFTRCALSLRKGLRKTELAAFIAAAELHPDAPVRFNGWKGKRLAPGKSVNDPYIPMVAFTEEQSNELAYAALVCILGEGPLADDFDIGLERIIRKDGKGKAVSVATSPNATDGARTTFQVFDETHRMTLPRQRQAHQTMMANLPKRVLSDAWSLETTTAPEPGAGSIAEATMDYALSVISGKTKDAALFFFHRQASDHHDLTTTDGVRAAVEEASGASKSWSNIDRIVEQWDDPSADLTFLERVWTNRLVQSSSQAFDVVLWDSLKVEPNPVEPGEMITIGFDGAQFHDSTALVATAIRSGYQWVAGLWECPANRAEDAPRWEVPVDEVNRAVKSLFDTYTVWRMYADPPYWNTRIAEWMAVYGEERVIEWLTNRRKPMTYALENFTTAMREGSITHGGDPRLKRHIGNSRRLALNWHDEQGKPLYLIQKERSDSPHKIDAAMAAVLSWQARTDAIASGMGLEYSGIVRNLAEFLH
jgi:phage terminase large subunit-like protein